MRTVISGGTVLTPHEALPGFAVVIEDGRVDAITSRAVEPSGGGAAVDAAGGWIVPGLVDLHVHGGDGCDTMDADPEGLGRIARSLVRHGVTTWLPTTMASTREATLAAVEAVAACPQPLDGAQHVGVHLEGPYLHPDHRGAQPARHLRAPDPGEYRAWFDVGIVRLVTVAPELDGALELIREGARRGVGFAVGHTGASFGQVRAAVDAGLRHATHTYNGMGPLHHREPGALGAVLTDDRITAQVIADGHHVHPAAVKLLVRAKGPGRCILISDAMRAAGLPDGDHDLGGQSITVRDGVPRTTSGSLAGSTLTLDVAVRNAARFTGLELQTVLPMATSVPTEAVGLGRRKGVLVPGADGDVVVFDRDLHVRCVLVAGRVVHRNAGRGGDGSPD